MASCGVMRVEKRGRGAVHGISDEADREKKDHERGRDFDQSDIDWNRTDDNIHLVHTDNWNREISRQIREAGVKERKNSTVLIDGLYTASRDWFDEHTPDEWMDYFRDCLDFHAREYCAGDKSRIINAVVHLDEATPHMHVASVPIFADEKGYHLSAKVLCGGRQDFRLHQDHFYDQVTKERGLERGEVREWGEIKAHAKKREWQKAKQEQELARQKEELERTRQEQERTQEQTREQERELDRVKQELARAQKEREQAQEQKEDQERELSRVKQEQEREQEQLARIQKECEQAQERLAEQEQELDRIKQEQEQADRLIGERKAAVKKINQQRLDALRERDKARAERDVERTLERIQKAVESPYSVNVEIIAEYEPKKPVWGQETPRAVKIAKSDLLRLEDQARVNEQTRRAAAALKDNLRELKLAAADANQNKIDKQAAANAAAVSEEGQRARSLQAEVRHLTRRLEKEQAKSADLSDQLRQEQEKGQETREILAHFPAEWGEMQERTATVRRYERAYAEHFAGGIGKGYIVFDGDIKDISGFLGDYIAECRMQDIQPKKEMQEHFENYSRHRSRDRGISL